MTSLVFKDISILSKAEKKARKVTFGQKINLLTGENDVGKSTLIKTLYHTLGADVPQLSNSRWKRARAVYCAHITLGGKTYYILRDERFFGVFDSNRKLISRHAGISGEDGIARFINPLLSFNIELERHADKSLGPAGPAYYFLPFYIDQDSGWTASWASFSGLQQFKDYRKHMLEYHLSIRPQSYYDAKKQAMALEEQNTKLSAEKAAIINVRDSYHKRKVARVVDLDPAVFRAEVEQLVDQYNEIYVRQQKVLQQLKDIRNDRHSLEHEVDILQRAIKELDGDYALAESPETGDPVGCPTCGTLIENSIVERFGILDDIDHCYSLIDQRRKKLVDVKLEEDKVADQYRVVTAELAPVNDLLQRQRQSVTFADFVSSEGIKDVMSSIDADIADIAVHQTGLMEQLAALADDLKVNAAHKKKVNAHYQARMKEYLTTLNVHVLELSDYKSYEKQIKSNALGSDLPRSLLAQCFAYLHTMGKFGSFVTCPLVIDSPLQQDQDKVNAKTIFDFIFSHTLPGQQLIVGTVSLPGIDQSALPAGTQQISLEGKYGLLLSDQYDEVFGELDAMHQDTLASA